MKTLRLFLLLLLVPFMASAASPSFNSFLPTQFTNNGVVIGLNTNYVITWQMVSANSFTTNGNNLAVNTNTFPTILVVSNMISVATNIATTNLWQVFQATNVFRSRGLVGIGTATPVYPLHIDTSYAPAGRGVMLTNSSAGSIAMVLTASGVPVYTADAATGQSTFIDFRGHEATITFMGRHADVDQKFTQLVQGTNTFRIRSLNDAAGAELQTFRMTNRAPDGMLLFGTNGVLYLSATGQQVQWPDATRQITSGTNTTRHFGLGGITVSPSNNTANGSIDYRYSSAGDTNFPHVVITNGVLYGVSLWTAASDATNYVLTLSENAERTINMTANVRVVGIDALAPAGFRGFVGVTVTNNSGSTFTVETTNTFRPYGTNSFSIPSGKDARIVFQIDENRVFYGGTVTP